MFLLWYKILGAGHAQLLFQDICDMKSAIVRDQLYYIRLIQIGKSDEKVDHVVYGSPQIG